MAEQRRALGELLQPDVDEVEVIAAGEYRIAGVYGFGQGVFARGPIQGSDTSYKKLHRLHAGQLVLSRLKAFEGAIAVVPEAFDGWFLSPEFPTFRCVEDELDHRYLAHICRWSDFWSMLAATSKGIGARRERVHADDLLRIELGVPPIDQQRLVAERLDRLEVAANELKHRSGRASTLSSALAVSASTRPDLDDDAKSRSGWREIALGDVVEPSTAQVQVQPSQRYQIAGIYSFGRGLIDRGAIDGAETSYRTLTTMSEGDIVLSKLNGWEGAVAVVAPHFDGYCVSSEYPTFKPDRSRLLPAFFVGIARSPAFWDDLNSNARGSMVRRRRINAKEFLATRIWLPQMETQQGVARLLQMVDRATLGRDSCNQRIDALLPAALNQTFASLS